MEQTVSYRRIAALAWPASVAAAVTPLLGAVDVWALAHKGLDIHIAAIGLASVVFSMIYWSFGFIRMSVAGLSAQAAGAGDEEETRAALLRGAIIGLGIGVFILLLQAPISYGAFALMAMDSNASAETFSLAEEYFAIRVWGAPFVMSAYAAFGWLSARERTDYLMIAAVAMTLINIALDYLFVAVFGWGAAGVAIGTLIAEIAGFLFCCYFVWRIMRDNGGLKNHWRFDLLRDPARLAQTVSINRDIFIRTVLLAGSFAWFVQRSGAYGDITLAANQTLLQLMLFTGLALDGSAIAAETLVGQSLGARDRKAGLADYKTTVRRTFVIAGSAACLFALLYGIAGDAIIALLTPPGELRDTTREFMPWVIASPLIVAAGFQLDGIFIGATRAREMRDGMIATIIVFIPATFWLGDAFGNHGLWAAFAIYFLMRALVLSFFLPRIAASFETQR